RLIADTTVPYKVQPAGNFGARVEGVGSDAPQDAAGAGAGVVFFDHPSGYNRIHSAMVWKGENLELFEKGADCGGGK
ncbi:MAG: hypothetical protein WBD93_16780, partial [Acidobacteriaceae bacterium]